ncbi:MAG: hypothetical protein ACE5OY_02050 [Candidatus Bathyarchaeia archaeon]
MISRREFIARLLVVLVVLGLPTSSPIYKALSGPTQGPKEPDQQVEEKEETAELPPEKEGETEEPPPKEETEEPPQPPEKPPEVREFEFSYNDRTGWDLHDITVNKGDTVRITIHDGDKSHSTAFSIALYAYQFLGGNVVTIEFEATMRGNFPMYPTSCHCSDIGWDCTLTVA